MRFALRTAWEEPVASTAPRTTMLPMTTHAPSATLQFLTVISAMRQVSGIKFVLTVSLLILLLTLPLV